jgi:hypothetical protein
VPRAGAFRLFASGLLSLFLLNTSFVFLLCLVSLWLPVSGTCISFSLISIRISKSGGSEFSTFAR